MFDFTFTTKSTVPVKYLKASCDVRYWEDANVNGVEDSKGLLIPLRNGDNWEILIDLETGVIQNWPEGTTANIHYKVCDAGLYSLVDDQGREWGERDGYVPSMLSPGGSGYGDYLIMTVGPDGKVADWDADLSYFEEDED